MRAAVCLRRRSKTLQRKHALGVCGARVRRAPVLERPPLVRFRTPLRHQVGAASELDGGAAAELARLPRHKIMPRGNNVHVPQSEARGESLRDRGRGSGAMAVYTLYMAEAVEGMRPHKTPRKAS